jgi:hypothetical protein
MAEYGAPECLAGDGCWEEAALHEEELSSDEQCVSPSSSATSGFTGFGASPPSNSWNSLKHRLVRLDPIDIPKRVKSTSACL